ncbi:MAG: protein of unknown function containing DUF4440 domain [Rhodobacteraceae bacterium HLUCCA08]|nr:MAG: protein of unknown function containing DUF4440 domain [Rhodobacteraceae bacterium HLUCCA08]
MDRLLTEVLAEETQVWEALVKGDTEAYQTALAEEFEGVYPDGVFGRETQLAVLEDGPTIDDYALASARVRPIGADHAMLIYHARYRRAGQVAWEAMRVTSLWRRRRGGWVNVFSQDTPEGAPVP